MISKNRIGRVRWRLRGPFFFLSLIPLLISSSLSNEQATETAVEMSKIVAVWANNGEDKVTRDERRASLGRDVRNSVWDGSRIKVFGARNEVISFNLILEAGAEAAKDVSVSLNRLTGPDGARISTKAVKGDGVFESC